MVFARIVHFYSSTRKVLVFSPSILALIFVTLDIVSFVIQLVGGGMAGPGASVLCTNEGLEHLHGRNWHAGRLHYPVDLFLAWSTSFTASSSRQKYKDVRPRKSSVGGDGSPGRYTDAYWQSPSASSIAWQNSPLGLAQKTLFQAMSLSWTFWSRHQCGWPFLCGTSFILVTTSEVQTPRCHLRGCRVISAAAVANVAVTTAM
ncbi:hypothetical protein AUEXF2481DRAFT_468731 [Aureobasidium subglaciale EXF-2481]|uniref:Uncharacterized protein n=1 Tax=Aureobasidium subglaciale (strain EXF-2481) TaxID=1043005 RepID=A0A074YVD6_AURSE|nr:uncharacterized protein AUEXF2481DRAFT_468731 [Aureobasidium subglaciale EXF-2481]KEQ98102.1 hypothetical protein AUEXF2481DRAFT_468731 [Aureobasidium subglaciale EXF-2481]